MESTASPIPEQIVKHVSQLYFSWYDYILFCVMLAVSCMIGIYFGCFGTKQSTADEYLMGNKKMKVFPVSVSLVASHISGITLLAVPADVYRYGATYWLMVFSFGFVLLGTMYVFLPVFYNLGITSTYEYLERRFDKNCRIFASFLFTLGLFLYLPIVIYVPALAFSAATGISIKIVAPTICGICIFYTTLGGLKAVVWTDTLQFIITVGAVVTVVFIGIRSEGGFRAMWSKALEGQRLDIFDFDLDPTKRDSFWSVTVGITFGWLSMAGIHQSCVQKFLSVPTFREAQLTVIYFTIGIVIVSTFSVITGLIMYARYSTCDPFSLGVVQKSDQLLPYYIMDVASHIPGLPGLFIAGIFCAALSTLSASLNCLSGTLFEDFIVKITGPFKNKHTVANILKLLVVITGVLCTALVFVIEHLGGLLQLSISLGGVTAGPLLGLFTLGTLFPKASSKGAFYGSIFSLLFCGWIVVMAQYYKNQGLVPDIHKPLSTDGCLNNATVLTINNSTSYSTEAYDFNNKTIEYSINSTISPLLNNSWEQTSEKSKPFFLFRISHYYYTPIGTMVTVLCSLLLSYILPNNDPPVHKDLLTPLIHPLLTSKDTANKNGKDYLEINKALHLITINTHTEKE